MLGELNRGFFPNIVVILLPTDVHEPEILDYVEYIRNYRNIDGRATAYVCSGRACQPPTASVEEMLRLITPAPRDVGDGGQSYR